ncbi:MAG: V-type ATPase subunit [Candidatus Diapherotrites archaeon]|nr:V-type ATPase subunit [Candidatus Diapherotrites archaeon]
MNPVIAGKIIFLAAEAAAKAAGTAAQASGAVAQASGPELIAFWVVAGAILGVLALVAVTVKKILPIMAFAYPVTRVRAMGSRMVKERKLRELAESYSHRDVIAAFEGTAYEPNVSGKKEIEEIEKGLALNLAKDYERIVKMTPKSASEFFRLVSYRYEIENVKRILESKATGEPITMLYPSPLSESFIERLKESEGMEETLGLLKQTNLKDAIEGLKADSSVEEIEKALDRHLYEKVFEKKKMAEVAKKAGVLDDKNRLLEIYGTQVDMMNIKIALRGIAGRLGEREIKEIMIHNHYFLPEKNANAMAEAKDIQSAIACLEGTRYYETLAEASRETGKGRGLSSVEKALDQYYHKSLKTTAFSQPFGLTPIAGYLALKESEIRTLTAILNGIAEGVPKERITEMFIAE